MSDLFLLLPRSLLQGVFIEFGRQLTDIRWILSAAEVPYSRHNGYVTGLTCEALEQRRKPEMTEDETRSIIASTALLRTHAIIPQLRLQTCRNVRDFTKTLQHLYGTYTAFLRLRPASLPYFSV